MQLKKSLFLMIFLLLNSAVQSLSYEYLDPKDTEEYKKKKIGDLIPIHTGEKILFKNEKYIAEAIIFLVNSSREKVEGELKSIIRTKMEIVSEVDELTKTYEESLTGFGDPEVKEWTRKELALLKSTGINLYSFHQTRVRTKYNFIKEVKGYSELEVEIIDGKDVLGKVCILVVMKRTDHWRDWGREWHTGIRIPIKVSGEGPIVTDTEVNLMEELKSKLGLKELKHFIPKSQYHPLLDVEMMKKIKEEVDKF